MYTDGIQKHSLLPFQDFEDQRSEKPWENFKSKTDCENLSPYPFPLIFGRNHLCCYLCHQHSLATWPIFLITVPVIASSSST
jgi:hypothetical protein